MSDRPTPECDDMWARWADEVLPNGQFKYGPDDLIGLARRLERQRDELLDELTVIRTVASYPHHPNALHAIQSISKNAIAAVKGGEG